MPFRDDFDEILTFVSAALSYIQLNYAVIPLRGDKRSAITWKPYQSRRTSERELQSWVDAGLLSGLGIVTGRVSQLAVLDFDDEALFEQFQNQYPDLCETRQVRTRRGYHLYFHIGVSLTTRSHKGRGVDWLYEGCYAVAPPTEIQGHTYKLQRGGMPHKLTGEALRQIESFLDEQSSTQIAVEDISSGSDPLSGRDLLGLYQHLCQQTGSRNQALFQTSLSARDSGWTAKQTAQLLVEVHTHNQTAAYEPPAIREREAQATIQSAFSRPARPRKQREIEQLPNTVREAFFQRKQTYAVRTIEGLRLAGIRPGHWFSEAEARVAIPKNNGVYCCLGYFQAARVRCKRRDVI